MIISHEYQLVFVTTPKSGSHTGFTLMYTYFNAVETNFNHNIKIPIVYNGYYSFTFVRNPYERFCALYHACVVNDKKAFVPKYARENILNYAAWYAGLMNTNNYPRIDLCAAQHIWHKKSKIDNYIKIEKAEKVFNETFPELNIVLPHELKRKHPTWEDVRTPELTEYVNIWAGRDFELYGYKKDNYS